MTLKMIFLAISMAVVPSFIVAGDANSFAALQSKHAAVQNRYASGQAAAMTTEQRNQAVLRVLRTSSLLNMPLDTFMNHLQDQAAQSSDGTYSGQLNDRKIALSYREQTMTLDTDQGVIRMPYDDLNALLLQPHVVPSGVLDSEQRRKGVYSQLHAEFSALASPAQSQAATEPVRVSADAADRIAAINNNLRLASLYNTPAKKVGWVVLAVGACWAWKNWTRIKGWLNGKRA